MYPFGSLSANPNVPLARRKSVLLAAISALLVAIAVVFLGTTLRRGAVRSDNNESSLLPKNGNTNTITRRATSRSTSSISRFEIKDGDFVTCAWVMAPKKTDRRSRRCSRSAVDGSAVKDLCPAECSPGGALTGAVILAPTAAPTTSRAPTPDAQDELLETPSTEAPNELLSPRALYTYDFGGLDDLPSVARAGDLLTKLGYAGIVVRTGEPAELAQYQKESADRGEKFSVVAGTLRHLLDKSDPDDVYRAHRQAIDLLANNEGDLWVWFRDRIGNGQWSHARLADFIRPILAHAKSRGVRLVLYPHSNNVIDNLEDAANFVNMYFNEEAEHFGVAANFVHEIRAERSSKSQFERSFSLANGRIFAVTIAGMATDNATIVSLDENQKQRELGDFLEQVKNSGFGGSIGFLNHQLEEPQDYLNRTMTAWRALSRNAELYDSR